MITLTKLNGSQFTLNPDMIEIIEANPDTTIRLISKNLYIARESVPEIIAKVIEFRRSCHDINGRISLNQ